MAVKFEDYNAISKQIRGLAKTYSAEVKNAANQLLTKLNDFMAKYKINCGYAIAIPQDKAKQSMGGIHVGKVTMPTTLLNFLLSKYVNSNSSAKNKGAKKPTAQQLLGMLLKHQRFNVALRGSSLLVQFDSDAAAKIQRNSTDDKKKPTSEK